MQTWILPITYRFLFPGTIDVPWHHGIWFLLLHNHNKLLHASVNEIRARTILLSLWNPWNVFGSPCSLDSDRSTEPKKGTGRDFRKEKRPKKDRTKREWRKRRAKRRSSSFFYASESVTFFCVIAMTVRHFGFKISHCLQFQICYESFVFLSRALKNEKVGN